MATVQEVAGVRGEVLSICQALLHTSIASTSKRHGQDSVASGSACKEASGLEHVCAQASGNCFSVFLIYPSELALSLDSTLSRRCVGRLARTVGSATKLPPCNFSFASGAFAAQGAKRPCSVFASCLQVTISR